MQGEMITPEGLRVRVSVNKTPLEKMSEPLEISISSEKANAPHIEKGRFSPYGGTRAQEITLKQDTLFVRVHGDENAMSKAQGRWVMRRKDIEGLTPEQIRDTFALPEIPTHITDIYAPAGTKLVVGKVALQAKWGKGGAIQYELKTQLLDEAFRNTRLLGDKK